MGWFLAASKFRYCYFWECFALNIYIFFLSGSVSETNLKVHIFGSVCVSRNIKIIIFSSVCEVNENSYSTCF